MGDGDGSKKILRTTSDMETLSLDVSAKKFSRDLLQRFRGSTSEYKEEKEEDEGIELNLGLSLGGRFGVDKNSKKLVRSSSIAGCLPVVKDDNDLMASTPVAYTGLVRTSSLPVETEEEWRKRKELQTLRRMEAKRRRSEKQRNLKGEKEGGGSGGGRNLSSEERKEIEVNLRERLEREKSLAAAKKLGSSLGPQFGLSSWTAAAARQAILRGGIDVTMAKGKESHVGGSGGMQGFGQPASQESVESKGGSSSSVSDLDSKTLQGSSDELSPTSIQSLKANNPDVGYSGNKSREQTSKFTGSDKGSPSKRPGTSGTRGREIGANSLEDMPSVFTMGDGPNGRRVDGILYRYGKGEEVRIMCVCCGNFHSPAEFVEHAGGKDVDHPLKHIVINPHSSSLR